MKNLLSATDWWGRSIAPRSIRTPSSQAVSEIYQAVGFWTESLSVTSGGIWITPGIGATQRKPNTNGFCSFITEKGFTMKMLPIMIALITVFGLSGCNTFAGMGKDIQSVGGAVENQAK
jgi:predicted small secreted protein